MLDKLYLSKNVMTLSGTVSTVPDVDYDAIATALNMNYDETTSVFYKGANSDNGFMIIQESNNIIKVYLYLNGAKNTSYITTVALNIQNNRAVLGYKKSSDNTGVVFGIYLENNVDTLSCAVSLSTNISTNEKLYHYSYTAYGSTSIAANIYLENGQYQDNIGYTHIGINGSDGVILFPLVSSTKNVVSDNVFVKVSAPFNEANTKEFTMNGDTYFTLYRYNGGTNLVFKV